MWRLHVLNVHRLVVIKRRRVMKVTVIGRGCKYLRNERVGVERNRSDELLHCRRIQRCGLCSLRDVLSLN